MSAPKRTLATVKSVVDEGKQLGSKNANGTYDATNSNIARTTLVLPVSVDLNLELCAMKMKLPKGELIKRVLVDFLKDQGFEPYKTPKTITVKYD